MGAILSLTRVPGLHAESTPLEAANPAQTRKDNETPSPDEAAAPPRARELGPPRRGCRGGASECYGIGQPFLVSGRISWLFLSITNVKMASSNSPISCPITPNWIARANEHLCALVLRNTRADQRRGRDGGWCCPYREGTGRFIPRLGFRFNSVPQTGQILSSCGESKPLLQPGQ